MIFQMKWICLTSTLVAVLLTLMQLKTSFSRRALSSCIAQLEQLAREADSNQDSIMEPFQLFPVNTENGYRPTVFGYEDSEGKIVLPATFTQARHFREGVAAVANENWYWGFINSEGQQIIPYQFGSVSNFHGGVAAFQGIRGDKHKAGFINRRGEIIILLGSDGGSFTSDFLGFTKGRMKSTRWAWNPLGTHGNPHPRVDIIIDCTGRVIEAK